MEGSEELETTDTKVNNVKVNIESIGEIDEEEFNEEN